MALFAGQDFRLSSKRSKFCGSRRTQNRWLNLDFDWLARQLKKQKVLRKHVSRECNKLGIDTHLQFYDTTRVLR